MNLEQRVKRIEKKLGISNGRLKPQLDCEYFFVDNDIEIEDSLWENDSFDMKRYDSGNCFRTKEQAKEAAKRVKQTLINYHRELGGIDG